MTLADLLWVKLKLLNERLWEDRARRPNIEEWLSNFAGTLDQHPSERLHALYLLSHFTYFGDLELREMLRSLFRDRYQYPIVESIRQQHSDTLDLAIIQSEFQKELDATRFLGMGNPAESGTHLLYFFRQENRLKKSQFIQPLDIFDGPINSADVEFANPDVTRLVFIDDFCGSGDQARRYSKRLLRSIREIEAKTSVSIHLSYLVLIATETGLTDVRDNTLFDAVDAVFTLNDSYQCFTSQSRYFTDCPSDITQAFAEIMARSYGTTLFPQHPLGYKDAQLLLGFHHNIPNNTLPIIWYAEPDHGEWRPIFKRYQKIYG